MKSLKVNRTEETYKKLGIPMTVEGFIKLNDMKKQFNFLRSLDSKHQYGSWKPSSEYTGILWKRGHQKKVNEPFERVLSKQKKWITIKPAKNWKNQQKANYE